VNQSERDIERALGRQFLQGLREIATGSWRGPIVSGFGLHLVYISERIDGEIPKLNEVRDQVFRDWASQQRKQTNKLIYENLRKRYKITVQLPLSENTNNASLKRDAG
jgi:parvulin-like peptidyl-prolyl isomerase